MRDVPEDPKPGGDRAWRDSKASALTIRAPGFLMPPTQKENWTHRAFLKERR